jgi:HD-GYP domain-containing protein (c-di-GMP phosphodiesterase class II)
MKLVPFSQQYLRPDEALPFGLRDAGGRLLLAAGATIAGPEQLAMLRQQALFCDEAESQEWRRRLQAAMDEALRRNVSLKAIAEARPDRPKTEAAAQVTATIAEHCQAVAMPLDAALRSATGPEDARSGWLDRVRAVHQKARASAELRFDATLYYLIYTSGHFEEKYSCHHALLTMLVCEQAAATLGWPAEDIEAIGLAALTMNVAMVQLQDQLAKTEHAPTEAMRADITAHAGRGEALLREAGLADEGVLEAVRWHHAPDEPDDAAGPLAALPRGRRLSRLLRRVDIFCAKIARRRTRLPMSPVRAAREACLAANGQPDEIGAALLKAVGLYPPGSFVELASGEVGIVVARGRRANLPWVASLVSAAGTPLIEPALRDTIRPQHAVKGPVPIGSVRVRPPHERVLALR